MVALAAEAPRALLSRRIDALAEPAVDTVLDEIDLRIERAQETHDEAYRIARGRPFTAEDPSVLLEAARVLQTAGLFGFLSADVRRARRLASRLLPPSGNAMASDGLRKIAGAIAARRAAGEFEVAARLLGPAFEGTRTDTKPLRLLRGWIRRTAGKLSRSARPEIAAHFWMLPATDLEEIADCAKALEPFRPPASHATRSGRRLTRHRFDSGHIGRISNST